MLAMGVYCHYQALPADSRLLARLRTEPRLYAFYAELVNRPCGPFNTSELDRGEFEDLLNDLARAEVFGSRPAAEGAVADFRAELAKAVASHPGLEGRTAYIKLDDAFEARLADELGRLGRHGASEEADRLMLGCEPLGPNLFPGEPPELQLVSAPVVAEAAGWLSRITPEVFGWLAEDYRSWQRVYQEAAQRGEAIVIG
jgi:hypothetical protein